MTSPRSAIAFEPHTPDRLRHRILGLLHGVGDPVASAILTVWLPDEHTVLDYRALAALQKLRELHRIGDAPGGTRARLPAYWTFRRHVLALRDSIAPRPALRNVDRALRGSGR